MAFSRLNADQRPINSGCRAMRANKIQISVEKSTDMAAPWRGDGTVQMYGLGLADRRTAGQLRFCKFADEHKRWPHFAPANHLVRASIGKVSICKMCMSRRIC